MYEQTVSLNLLPILLLAVMISAIVILCKELPKFVKKQTAARKKKEFRGLT